MIYYVVGKNKRTGFKWTWNKIMNDMSKFYPNGVIRLETSETGDALKVHVDGKCTLIVRLNKIRWCGREACSEYENIPKNSFIFSSETFDSSLIKHFGLNYLL